MQSREQANHTKNGSAPNQMKPIRKRKFVGEDAYTIELPVDSPRDTDLKEIYRAKILIEKNRRVTSRAKRGTLNTRRGKAPDFDQLEASQSPQISFEPGSALRPAMIQILERPERDVIRKKLMAKLGTEFERIYSRYRRDAQREHGRAPDYYLPEKEKPYAAEAAMWCVVKGVSPRQLLEYWHIHIKTFANRGLKFPPLALLKSPGIVDQAACATMDARQPSVSSANRLQDGRPDGKNSFSDVNSLDRRFRSAATKAGFDLSEYSDRYLVTLQKMAIGTIQGERVFISAKLKDLVSWAAENLYADVARG